MRNAKPTVAALEPARWEGWVIRRFHVDGHPTWLFADVWRALGIARPRATGAIDSLIMGRHKWHVDVDDEPGMKMTAIDAHGLDRLLASAPIPEQAASMRRALLGRPVDAEPAAPPESVLIERDYHGGRIRQRADGYLCLTEMARAAGKAFADWNRLQSTDAFLSALSADMGIPISALLDSSKGGIARGGTWAHPQVAHAFAMWCSPEFAVKVTGWVEDIRTKGVAVDARRPDGLRELIRSELRAVLREELGPIVREELPRQLPAPSPGRVLLPGELERSPGRLTIGLPAKGEYKAVADILLEGRVAMPKGPRHTLGRRVAEAYRIEARQHADDQVVWPREPIRIERAGNYYPPQTWPWLRRTVLAVVDLMGYSPRRLQPDLFRGEATQESRA